MADDLDDLRMRALEECLALNRQALAIFDAIEARSITMDTARAVAALGQPPGVELNIDGEAVPLGGQAVDLGHQLANEGSHVPAGHRSLAH